MQVSSHEAPARRWVLNVYLILASLILLGIFLQGFLIGALLFAGAGWGKEIHSFMGLVLLVLALLLALVGVLAPLPGSMKVWSIVLFFLVFIQMILASLGNAIPFVAAFHPANAMLLFGLNLFLLLQVRRIMRGSV
jgi:heme A synthase